MMTNNEKGERIRSAGKITEEAATIKTDKTGIKQAIVHLENHWVSDSEGRKKYYYDELEKEGKPKTASEGFKYGYLLAIDRLKQDFLTKEERKNWYRKKQPKVIKKSNDISN